MMMKHVAMICVMGLGFACLCLANDPAFPEPTDPAIDAALKRLSAMGRMNLAEATAYLSGAEGKLDLKLLRHFVLAGPRSYGDREERVRAACRALDGPSRDRWTLYFHNPTILLRVGGGVDDDDRPRPTKTPTAQRLAELKLLEEYCTYTGPDAEESLRLLTRDGSTMVVPLLTERLNLEFDLWGWKEEITPARAAEISPTAQAMCQLHDAPRTLCVDILTGWVARETVPRKREFLRAVRVLLVGEEPPVRK